MSVCTCVTPMGWSSGSCKEFIYHLIVQASNHIGQPKGFNLSNILHPTKINFLPTIHYRPKAKVKLQIHTKIGTKNSLCIDASSIPESKTREEWAKRHAFRAQSMSETSSGNSKFVYLCTEKVKESFIHYSPKEWGSIGR